MEPRKRFYTLFGVPRKKAVAFDKAHPPPLEGSEVKAPPRKRNATTAAGRDTTESAEGKKEPHKKRRKETDEEAEASDRDSDAEEV